MSILSETWKYVENQFDNATKESRKRMNTLMVDHWGKLEPNSLPALRTRTLPVWTAWHAAYTGWLNAQGYLAGATLSLETRFDDLTRLQQDGSTLLSAWDVKLQVAYPKGGPTYKTIFPFGHAPIHEGSIDDRIAALQGIAARIPAAPPVQDVKDAMTDWVADLADIRQGQQDLEADLTTASNAVETQRIASAKILYKNLGWLMDAHSENPVEIAVWYDLEALRDMGEEEEPVVPIPPPVV